MIGGNSAAVVKLINTYSVSSVSQLQCQYTVVNFILKMYVIYLGLLSVISFKHYYFYSFK